MGASRRTLIGALLLSGFVQPSTTSAQKPAPTVDEFLFREMALTPAQTDAVAHGEVVAKLVPTTNDRDVTTFGVIRVNVPRSFFEARNLDFPRDRKSTRLNSVTLESRMPSSA